MLVGEVWFCSGQSNMQQPLGTGGEAWSEENGQIEAKLTDEPTIRFATCSAPLSATVKRTVPATNLVWKAFRPDTLGGFGNVPYHFAMNVRRSLKGVPIGLVWSAVGGSNIRPWISAEGYADVPELDDLRKSGKLLDESMPEGKKKGFWPLARQPTVFYNAKVAPVAPYALRGTIWYQGESNIADGDRYRLYLHALAKGWRRSFENDAMEFYTVQPMPYLYKNKSDTVLGEFWTAQQKFAAEDPHAAYVVTDDCGLLDEIHSPHKRNVGLRLALCALNRCYGRKDLEYRSPAFKSATIVSNGVVAVSFDHAPQGLYIPDYQSNVRNFELCGADGVWHEAKGWLNRSRGWRLEVASDKVPHPLRIRYMYRQGMRGDLYSRSSCLMPGAFVGSVGSGDARPLRVTPKAGETLVRLRDRVRAIPARDRARGVEVVLPSGSYALDRTLEFDERDGGTSDAPVVWRAADLPKGRPGKDEGRLPQIVAGIDLPPASFHLVTNADLLARLDPEARGQVFEADISKLRFNWPVPQPMESEIKVPLAMPDLFVNGRRMAIATFPAAGWCEMTKITDRGSILGDRNLETALRLGVVKREEVHGGTFGYAEERPARWAAHPHVAIQAFWRFDWRETVIYAKSIDPAAKTITLGAPHSFGLGEGNSAPRRWRAVNVFEELAAPGRYAVDFASRRLYFYPPADFAAAGAGVCAAQEPTVRVKKGAHDLVFDGLHFGRSCGSALSLAGCDRVTVRRCLFTDARDLALVTKAARRTTVRTCDFYRLGGGGAQVDDGDRRTLARGESVIEDCLFHHWNALRSGSNAAIVGGVGNAIRHCEMRDTTRQATGTRGNDCVFEYNVLSNICTATDDAGAFYKGCNPSMRGNVIRYNYFRNIGWQGHRKPHGAAAIYFDDGDGGDLVYGCVFEKAALAGFGNFAAVFSHGGHSNIVRNCIFVDCQRAIGSGPWTQKHWSEYLFAGKSSDSQRVRRYMLEDVDVTKPPYTTHYPELVALMKPEPDEARWNAAYDNAFVNCPLRLPDEKGKLAKPGLVAGRWHTNETSVVITGDPGFANRAAHDFRLRGDSEIYRKIPNFKPIPFEKIGLLTR